MKTYLSTGTKLRVQRSAVGTLNRLATLKTRCRMSPLEAAVFHLTVDRRQSILDVARDTGLPLRQLLAVNRDAQRKHRLHTRELPTLAREALGVGITDWPVSRTPTQGLI